MPVMRKLVDQLQEWNFRVCGIFVLDSHFMVDGGKFISGAMAALSCMVSLELPAVNVLSKVDCLQYLRFGFNYTALRLTCCRPQAGGSWTTSSARTRRCWTPTVRGPHQVAGPSATRGSAPRSAAFWRTTVS